MKEDEDEDSE